MLQNSTVMTGSQDHQTAFADQFRVSAGLRAGFCIGSGFHEDVQFFLIVKLDHIMFITENKGFDSGNDRMILAGMRGNIALLRMSDKRVADKVHHILP